MASPVLYSEVLKCVPGPGVNLDIGVDSLYSGCNCSGQCDFKMGPAQCNCSCPYTEDGHLSALYLVQDSGPIMECNSNCTCDCYCLNRTTQRSPSVRTTLISTENKGAGVVSTCYLQRGAFVGEYVGELLTNSMATERLRSLSTTAKCFIIQYHEHLSSGNIITTNVDATHKGNVMRFINHSCEPNLIVIPVRSNSIVPRLCFFTCKNITAGEELCFSYFGKKDSKPVPIGSKKCYCGSSNCIGYLPLIN